MSKPPLLVTNFVHVPDLWDEEEWARARGKLARDLPWVLARRDPVAFSGVARGWRGRRTRENVASRAVFRSRANLRVDGVLAWVSHLVDCLRLSRPGPLVVFAPTPQAGWAAAAAKAVMPGRIRLVVRVQGITSSKARYVQGARLRAALKERIEAQVIRRADLVVPMGGFTRARALATGARSDDTITLPFPVTWAERAEVTELPSQPTVLFIGRLEKEKGVQVLLEAMARVVQTLPRSRLVVAGEGSYRTALEDLTGSLGLVDEVRFVGWVQAEGLLDLYRRASVVVLPSLWEEGLGMVLVEAGLMGRPVIGSRLGGIQDVVNDRENGLLVPPSDARVLADALLVILGDREGARRMGLAGHAVASGYLAERETALRRLQQSIDALSEAEPRPH